MIVPIQVLLLGPLIFCPTYEYGAGPLAFAFYARGSGQLRSVGSSQWTFVQDMFNISGRIQFLSKGTARRPPYNRIALQGTLCPS